MIRVEAAAFSSSAFPKSPLAVFAFEGGDLSAHRWLAGAQAKRLARELKAEGAKGALGEVVRLKLGGRSLLVVGLGKKGELDAEKLRRASGHLCRWTGPRFASLAVSLPEVLKPAESALAVAEGLLLASYRYTKYKKVEEADRPKLESSVLLAGPAARKAADAAVRRAAVRADAVAFVRDLVNDGPSDKKPAAMAELARSLAGSGVEVEVFGPGELSQLGMNAILGVARGSAEPPRFVHLTYKPSGRARKKVALVGKGITFDSGGLSLKPPQSMETMKLDMAGGACVLAAFKALKELKLPVEVHGFVPFTYNLPAGDALKPGDVLRAYNGKTIEVLNTDAEGRLVLSDALAYASKMKFDAILDLATLTGAALVALGSSVTAAMTNDRKLWYAVRDAAERAGEPMWELPLFADYKEQIKSKVADLQNIGSVRGEAGTIIGGLFLQEFVDSSPWIHLDIAGTAWADRGGPYKTPGGTGEPVRTILNYLEAL